VPPSQTTTLPPGTVFGAPDKPVPSPNGDNVFYPRPYRASLNNHDEETGPYRHPPAEATAEDSDVNMEGGAGDHQRYLNRYSSGLPSTNIYGESATMRRRTGVSDPIGQGGCGVYGGGVARCCSRGGSSHQQEAWQGKPSGCSCSGPTNTGLGPSTCTSDLTRERRPSSSNFPDGPPFGEDCPRFRGEGNVEGDLDDSFRPLSRSALSMAPPPMMTPSPGVNDADRWGRDNVNTNNGLTRLENLERMVFGEGFMKGLPDGRNPASKDCTGQREEALKPACNCSGNNNNDNNNNNNNNNNNRCAGVRGCFRRSHDDE